MRTAVESPCLNCPERHEGCHGKCEAYKNYKIASAKEKEEIKRRKDAFLSYAAERKKRRGR